MERVRKTFFDPLAASKARVREILEELPVGSAHPFSPERLLLCRTESGIDEIDISPYPDGFFSKAVDMGEMGEILLRRMAGYPSHLGVFEDFQILQAPASTFKIPIVSGQITLLAVSERTPTYYDFCFADASSNVCCWNARRTFPGMTHSDDIYVKNDLLDYVKIAKESFTEKELCVFISGFNSTPITRFLGTHPALLVADHVDKVLYIVPVPLDKATIGQATICCPLVIKRDGDSLICSILPTATTDLKISANGDRLESASYAEAINRADFCISATSPNATQSNSCQYQDKTSSGADAHTDAAPMGDTAKEKTSTSSEIARKITKENAVFTTDLVTLPSFLDLEKAQVVRFGTGIEFELPGEKLLTKAEPSAVVLPCIFGTQLEGPFLLATGTVPSDVPFANEISLREYYKQLKSAVVIVDDRMTDNARNLAPIYRINALFIVQISPQSQPNSTDEIMSLLNSANINAVTALAGPQSLILVQISERYYFYRGIANRAHINTSRIEFGSDVTSILEAVSMESILDPRIQRIVTLGDEDPIVLPTSGQLVQPKELQALFEKLPINQVEELEEDISAAIPQLQMLLNEKDLRELSRALVFALSTKISSVTAPLKNTYSKYIAEEFKITDPESAKKKNSMLGELRKLTRETQLALEPLISSLSNMISARTTSKRTHDMKRLIRQTQIQANVEVVKSMTFDTLAGYLETYAGEMGVMLLNIETSSYSQLLGNLKGTAIDASPCCDLDSRVLHLEGFDAGIIIEQSQANHDGPLRCGNGLSHPILALPYLSQGLGTGSMLAWVCWDEFVNLESPYTVRWMEKCNEAHIAALRIIMRSTLSQAVSAREYNIQPSSPETGQLMSALLMAAMSKLAAMKTTAPVVSQKAGDTVTRLMRGLFGNLLTIAGSGVRPQSMVWQLFGLNSSYDLPKTDVGWNWYETVVALYPYTGWPLEQFYENLEKLLDKAVVRVVTKNERTAWVSGREKMIRFSKLRNIQLHHSRTIITVFMRMLTMEESKVAPIATRLLKQLPRELKRQSEGYTIMIRYLEHLSNGGQRRYNDDLVAATIYATRSAAFGPLKREASKACKSKEWAKMKDACQAIIDKRVELGSLWHVNPNALKVHNLKLYKALLNADFGDDIDEDTKTNNLKLSKNVFGDAEKERIPWQVGKKGEFGDEIEPLDKVLLDEILFGPKSGSVPVVEVAKRLGNETTAMIETKADEFTQFESAMESSFISEMRKNISAENVCRILDIPATTMRVFSKALNPQFVWDDLGKNFKVTILGLLENRSNRAESRPAKKLLELKRENTMLQIDE
ncbi:hypothetical protein N7517_000093 [Penicillium concentricum]|uniref:Uncharacterized protein n=1 Tax=Penicillium concentricum TaxID=293559 RepID=A0A9W9VHK0_9EURO|nr:uncharacterized protein N7517_000093 [Penicillium concentricum]KAJ5382182.1 hypothetical protein N7517_000093 [Penicillium concentricum]